MRPSIGSGPRVRAVCVCVCRGTVLHADVYGNVIRVQEEYSLPQSTVQFTAQLQAAAKPHLATGILSTKEHVWAREIN